jgi:Ca-activated chloride channel family protein
MHFDRPIAFWFLILLLPILGSLIWAITVLRKLNEVPDLNDFLAYSNIPAWRRRIFVYVAYFVAITACMVAFAEPYVYISAKDKEYSNIRIIFVVDVSRSMVYAEDVPPNRLEATRKQIRDFYTSLDGIYECSILPFAGDVNPYFCPFTRTKLSFFGALDELDWRSAPTLGTDLTKAMEAIQNIYIKKDKIDKSGLNIVILLSDGGKEEALATNRIKLLQITRELSSKNFKIYTVGVGSGKAAPLIVRDSKGGFVRYITDNNNQIATSQLDEEILKQIADNGNGTYYSLNASTALSSDLDKVIKENRKLVSEKTKLEKLYLQPYLFSVTVCLLMLCLLLNKVW